MRALSKAAFPRECRTANCGHAGNAAEGVIGGERVHRRSPRIAVRKARAGRCFELAFKGQDRAPEWLLVHGLVRSLAYASSLQVIAHAWLELDDKVYDPVQDRFFARAEYYAILRAVAERRYTPMEAARAALSGPGCGTYGPWHDTAGALGLGPAAEKDLHA